MRTVDIAAVINGAPVSRRQILLIAICTIIAMLDGYDGQLIAYVAPVIAQSWHLEMSLFGPIFAAGLLGMAVGSLVLGPAADRFGRKTILVISLLIIGLSTLRTAQADSFQSLLLLRLVTGLGVGGATPNIIALTGEYSPDRIRGTTITLMFVGFPLGSMLGGFMGAKLVPLYGWQTMFYIGGALPIAFTLVAALWLPESIRYLVARSRPAVEIARILRHIDARQQISADTALTRYTLPEENPQGFPVKHLFLRGRGLITGCLWTAFFMNLMVLLFLVSWLPALARLAGQPIATAILYTSVFNLGGVFGGCTVGWWMDRSDPARVLAIFSAAAGIFIVVTAVSGHSLAILMPALFFAGFGIQGAQIGMNAYAAMLYPTAIRSTGVGWAFGVGRIGGISGPLIGGALVALRWSTQQTILVSVLPVLVVALAFVTLGRAISLQRAAESMRPAGAPDKPSEPGYSIPGSA